ncbi:MAG: ABC transporter permease [Pseudomonadales bacterium]|nr:ABC transporter permease [Pseudomonadales bacterium]
MKKTLSLFLVRNREFIRDKASLSWNLVFPLLMIIGFVFAFSGDNKPLFKVGYLEPTPTNSETTNSGRGPVHYPLNHPYIQWIPFTELETGINRVKHHQIDLLVELTAQPRYWINSDSRQGVFLEQLLGDAGVDSALKQPVTGRPVRYIDWVLPGILGMNIMFGGLFGVGYVIVRYRKNGVLKRLQATPVNAIQFLAAQIASRLIIVVGIAIIIFVGCDIFLDFLMLGSYIDLLIITILGAMCLISIGLLAASRTDSEELAGGLLNSLSWPMMFLSGVWFSLEGAHPAMKQLADWLPLTHMVHAAREIMINGTPLGELTSEIWILSAMTLFFLCLASILFRWNKN